MPGDPFKVLGLPRGASPQAVKKAFKALAREHHPDKSADPGAERRFAEIREAYELLTDPRRRAEWERGGKERAGRQDPEADSEAGKLHAGRFRRLVVERAKKERVDIWAVRVYASSWECAETADAWEQAVRQMRGVVHMARVRFEEEPALLKELGLPLFPPWGSARKARLLLFRAGKMRANVELRPGITPAEIRDVVERNLFAAQPMVMKSVADWNKFGAERSKWVRMNRPRSDTRFVFVSGVRKKPSLVQKALSHVFAGEIEFAHVFFKEAEPEVKEKLGVDGDTGLPIVIQLVNGEITLPFLMQSEIQNDLGLMADRFERHRHGAIPLLNAQNYYDLCFRDPPVSCVVVLARDSENAHSNTAPILWKMTPELRQRIQLAWMNPLENKSFLAPFNISDLDQSPKPESVQFIALGVESRQVASYPHLFNSQNQTKDVLDWMSKFSSGSATGHSWSFNVMESGFPVFARHGQMPGTGTFSTSLEDSPLFTLILSFLFFVFIRIMLR